MKAVVDTREENEVPHIRKEMEEEGFDTIVEVMEAGDYMLNGNILVERSTVSDFVGKISSKRIWEQLDKMKRSNCDSYRVVIEGSLSLATDEMHMDIVRESSSGKGVEAEYDGGRVWLPKSQVEIEGDKVVHIPYWLKKDKGIPEKGGWNLSSLFGVIESIQTDYEVIVDVIPMPKDEEKQAEYITKYLKAIAKEKEDKLNPLRVSEKKESPDEISRFIVEGLPTVGAEKAVRLLDKFGSVESVMSATVEDLETVHGIGESTAEEIREACVHEFSPE